MKCVFLAIFVVHLILSCKCSTQLFEKLQKEKFQEEENLPDNTEINLVQLGEKDKEIETMSLKMKEVENLNKEKDNEGKKLYSKKTYKIKEIGNNKSNYKYEAPVQKLPEAFAYTKIKRVQQEEKKIKGKVKQTQKEVKDLKDEVKRLREENRKMNRMVQTRNKGNSEMTFLQKYENNVSNIKKNLISKEEFHKEESNVKSNIAQLSLAFNSLKSELNSMKSNLKSHNSKIQLKNNKLSFNDPKARISFGDKSLTAEELYSLLTRLDKLKTNKRN